MANLKNSKHKQVLENLDVTRSDVMAWYLNVKRQLTVNHIFNHKNLGLKINKNYYSKTF